MEFTEAISGVEPLVSVATITEGNFAPELKVEEGEVEIPPYPIPTGYIWSLVLPFPSIQCNTEAEYRRTWML